jgi:hypothetical protein
MQKKGFQSIYLKSWLKAVTTDLCYQMIGVKMFTFSNLLNEDTFQMIHRLIPKPFK